MSLPIKLKHRVNREQEEDDSGGEETIDADDVHRMEKARMDGYRVVARKEHKDNLFILERPDEIKCRGKRPTHDRFNNSTSLHFGGRVKMPSKKNAQLELKRKLDGKLTCIL